MSDEHDEALENADEADARHDRELEEVGRALELGGRDCYATLARVVLEAEVDGKATCLAERALREPR